jgi:heat shock protein HslJ
VAIGRDVVSPFDDMALTMMACPGGMDTETKLLKVLGQAKQWKIAGQRLELMDSSGKGRVG